MSFKSLDQLTLHHITDAESAQSILIEGLRPTKETEETHYGSSPVIQNAVYLFHDNNQDAPLDWIKENPDSAPIVLDICLSEDDLDRLVADEDYFYYVEGREDLPGDSDVWRNHADDSLENMGAVAYLGSLLASEIRLNLVKTIFYRLRSDK